jgi:hypothetical protein
MTTEITRPGDDLAWFCSCDERGEWQRDDVDRGDFTAYATAKAGMREHQDALLDVEDVKVSQGEYMGDHISRISKRSDPYGQEVEPDSPDKRARTAAEIASLDPEYPHEQAAELAQDEDDWELAL